MNSISPATCASSFRVASSTPPFIRHGLPTLNSICKSRHVHILESESTSTTLVQMGQSKASMAETVVVWYANRQSQEPRIGIECCISLASPGSDLHGNTFWEFKDALHANRFRRIVRYNQKSHYADIQMSPQWIQWLRQTRADAPSILEQQQDVLRQAQMRQLAAAADERWASIPSYTDSPKLQSPRPAMDPAHQGDNQIKIDADAMGPKIEQSKQVEKVVASEEGPREKANTHTVTGQPASSEGQSTRRKRDRPRGSENPWTKTGGGDSWQPQSWAPGVAPRR